MSLSDSARIISGSVVPVVIISACGLLCLAFYNRLAVIVSRLRGFQRERLEEQDQLQKTNESAEYLERRRKLLQLLECQTTHVTSRAKLIQLTFFLLLSTITFHIGCCVMLGLSVVWSPAGYFAVLLFMLGLVTMFMGIMAAMLELKAALGPAELESRFVTDILGDARLGASDLTSPT